MSDLVFNVFGLIVFWLNVQLSGLIRNILLWGMKKKFKRILSVNNKQMYNRAKIITLLTQKFEVEI